MDESIKQRLERVRGLISRPCSELVVGGFRPTHGEDESWIGRVFLRGQNETDVVLDTHGRQLFALAQIYLPALPFVPKQLEGIKYLCVFIGREFPEPLSDNGDGWLIREYKGEPLVRFECAQGEAPRPFPLQIMPRATDFPLWDAGDIDGETLDEIIELENKHGLDYYDDIGTDHCYGHKFGGFPSFAQSGVAFGWDYEFVFQIASDNKAEFEVIDGGRLMFARNPQGKWRIYYDFY